jgi:hypothetical protein
MDSGAHKCLPKNPTPNDDQQISKCFESDNATMTARATYMNNMDYLNSKGSAFKLFQRHLKGNKPDFLALDSKQKQQQIIDRVNDITIRDCAKESLNMAQAMEEEKPSDEKFLAYAKWTTCMRINFCMKQVQQCLAKRSQSNLSTAWENSSAIDVMECIDGADQSVSSCVDVMETVMKKQMNE